MRQVPTVTWRGNPPSANGGGGPAASPKLAVAATPVFNGAQLRAPKRFARLELNGIMGAKKRPMIIVNNQTLAPGESARIDLNDRRVKVTCKEVRSKSAILLVEGQPQPQEIFLEGN